MGLQNRALAQLTFEFPVEQFMLPTLRIKGHQLVGGGGGRLQQAGPQPQLGGAKTFTPNLDPDLAQFQPLHNHSGLTLFAHRHLHQATAVLKTLGHLDFDLRASTKQKLAAHSLTSPQCLRRKRRAARKPVCQQEHLFGQTRQQAQGQFPFRLSLSLLARLPKKMLLLADRLSGCAAFAAEALRACQRVGSQFLFRARTQIKVQVSKRFKDGSRLVQVPVRKKGQPRVIVQRLELREIRVQIRRKGFRTTELRLWTSLLEPTTAPADELVALYAQRWEHELFYRELKRQLRKSAILQSHTVTTAAQEIAALILAASLLARERDRAAAGAVPVLRVSFIKLLELLRPLWLVLTLGDDLLE